MSKEATGQSGAKIGSSEYWSRANHTTMLGGLMGSKTSYQATIGQLGTKAAAAIEEIYEDLSALGSKIRYLPSSDRNALAKQVEGLYDICKMGGISARHNSECVQGLNLSIMSPWTQKFRNEREIKRAIDIINKSQYSRTEALKLLCEAAKWGVAFACGSDRAKRAFIEAVAQGNNDSFLQDVVDEYQGLDRHQRYEGKCGHPVGSRIYMTHMERQVFGTELPILICAASGNPDYEKLIKDALNSVVDQLGRDLDNAIRENDYITDETAAKLKLVVAELDRCGVSTGWLNSKIEKLAWFEGGDPAKIKELQRALNNLGVGQHLEEDGVYGQKTELAVDKVIREISDFLTDAKKVAALSSTVDALVAVSGQLRGCRIQTQAIYTALEKNRNLLQRMAWKQLAVDRFLPQRGCTVAAMLLKHSLEEMPGNLHFTQSHEVTKKIIQSKGFTNAFIELKEKIQRNPNVYAVNGSIEMDFQKSGDTDLYYGIGKCTIGYNCIRRASSVTVKFFINDRYDFDKFRIIQGDARTIIALNRGIGSIANDAGLISQADGVISPYHIFITFEKTIHLS